MEFLSAILVLLLSLITIVYWYFKISFGYWKSRGVPCEKPIFPYGSLKGLGSTYHLRDIIGKSYHKFKPTGAKLCGFYGFFSPVAIALDLQLIKMILVKDFQNFDDRTIFHNEKDDPLTANLITLNGERWRRLRLNLSSAFTTKKLKFMFPTVAQVGERLRDCLLEVTQKHEILEVKELMSRYTTDVIGTCMFGIECNSLKDPNAEFRRMGRRFFSHPRHSPLFLRFIDRYRNICQKLHFKLIADDVSAFFLKVVQETVEYREKYNVTRNDLMDILIELKNEDKAITLNEIAANLFVFFLAGYETSASTLTWTLYELAVNPDIQSKARRIIQEAYAKCDGNFTYEMMTDIPYIDQIVEETMRMHSSFPLISRTAMNDYHVPETDIIIERGTSVYVPVHSIHYDPEFYPNPEIFDPDRFSNDEEKDRDMTTFLPFGAGPRYCIGLRFGMISARIALVTLLNNFEISSTSPTVPPGIFKKQFLALPTELQLKFKPLKTFDDNNNNNNNKIK